MLSTHQWTLKGTGTTSPKITFHSLSEKKLMGFGRRQTRLQLRCLHLIGFSIQFSSMGTKKYSKLFTQEIKNQSKISIQFNNSQTSIKHAPPPTQDQGLVSLPKIQECTKLSSILLRVQSKQRLDKIKYKRTKIATINHFTMSLRECKRSSPSCWRNQKWQSKINKNKQENLTAVT